jgi:hypothetical protein
MNVTDQVELRHRFGILDPEAQATLSSLHQTRLSQTDHCYAVEFVHPWEEDFARVLDEHQIEWQYKPRTFAVEWDEEGNFVDSFTPDFFLPVSESYVQLIAPQDREAHQRARKVRLLRQQYPRIRIDLIATLSPSAVEEFFFHLRPTH